MKKIQMSVTALAVIFGAAGAVAFKAAPKTVHKINKNFRYIGLSQTRMSYNQRTNYVATISAGCGMGSGLCIITNVAATAAGLRPILPSGFGSLLAIYNENGTITGAPTTILGVSVTLDVSY